MMLSVCVHLCFCVHEIMSLCSRVYAWMHFVLQKLLRKSGLVISWCSDSTNAHAVSHQKCQDKTNTTNISARFCCFCLASKSH